MDGWRDLAVFAGVMAVGQFSPGPDMLLLTRTALAEGTRRGIAMAGGIATGLAIHATLAVGGSAAVFERSTLLKTSVAWLAAAYLTWLGIGLLRAGIREFQSGVPDMGTARTASHGAYVRGLLCNLLNPKAMLFLAAVATPFLTGGRPGWWPYALIAIVVVQGFVLWALWACLLQQTTVRRLYTRSAWWINLLFGATLIGLALRLIIT